MHQTINIQELENAMDKYGDIVLNKSSKNNIIIMSIVQYKEKLRDEKIKKKLLRAEQQIDEGKTIGATEVFEELEKEYGF